MGGSGSGSGGVGSCSLIRTGLHPLLVVFFWPDERLLRVRIVVHLFSFPTESCF